MAYLGVSGLSGLSSRPTGALRAQELRGHHLREHAGVAEGCQMGGLWSYPVSGEPQSDPCKERPLHRTSRRKVRFTGITAWGSERGRWDPSGISALHRFPASLLHPTRSWTCLNGWVPRRRLDPASEVRGALSMAESGPTGLPGRECPVAS